YRTGTRKITLDASIEYHPRIEVCDKTFPIIPSVLLENALKYSVDKDVRVTFRANTADYVIASVSNLAVLTRSLTDDVFKRGYRAAKDNEGSGNGLYVAQLVAKQHGSLLHVETVPVGGNRTRVTFWA